MENKVITPEQRFVEMEDEIRKAIDNINSVTKQQTRLINFLKKGKDEFKPLIDELTSNLDEIAKNKEILEQRLKALNVVNTVIATDKHNADANNDFITYDISRTEVIQNLLVAVGLEK